MKNQCNLIFFFKWNAHCLAVPNGEVDLEYTWSNEDKNRCKLIAKN